MSSQTIVAPADQRVTFVELLFDLVFVFSLTQIVSLLHDGLGWIHVAQAALAFWLVWRAWSQFTWALNGADTTHPRVELGVLFATAVAFFMAIAVPDAFSAAALWFAVPYILVRAVGLTLYYWIASASTDPSWRANVSLFALLSTGGLIAVLMGAYVGGNAQYALWGLAVPLDVIASAIGASRGGWNVRPQHFSERHGLFIIIALGETLIVAAAGITGRPRSVELVLAALLTVGIAFGLWWTYFTRARAELDEALESCLGAVQSRLARDAYTWAHFPMLCGIVAFAAAVEAALAHPDRPFQIELRIALAACLALFVGGMAAVVWRATGSFLWPRLALTVLGALAVVAWSGVGPQLSLALVFSTVVIITVLERPRSAAH